MKLKLIQKITKVASVAVALAMATGAFGADKNETMCVKQKDGSYKCNGEW